MDAYDQIYAGPEPGNLHCNEWTCSYVGQNEKLKFRIGQLLRDLERARIDNEALCKKNEEKDGNIEHLKGQNKALIARMGDI